MAMDPVLAPIAALLPETMVESSNQEPADQWRIGEDTD